MGITVFLIHCIDNFGQNILAIGAKKNKGVLSGAWRIPQRRSREIQIGSIRLGGQNPILLQSMCATRTRDIEATLSQIRLLEQSGAALIRLAIDSRKDVEALCEIASQTEANLVVDLQESYRLVEQVAPYVKKIRYNPGHLHHHQSSLCIEDKVRFIADCAGAHNCAIRVGVNFGSLDPELKNKTTDSLDVAVSSAENHCEILDKLGFKNYLVSLKSSDPYSVVEVNRRFFCPAT